MSPPMKVIREETWVREVDGRKVRAHVPVLAGHVVEVSYEALVQMFTELGLTKEDTGE